MPLDCVREIFPATFPSGEGSDLARVVEEVGAGVNGVGRGRRGDRLYRRRACHAEYVLVEATNLTAKPVEVPWQVADGGVGVFAVQLAVPMGARVIALAGERDHVSASARP